MSDAPRLLLFIEGELDFRMREDLERALACALCAEGVACPACVYITLTDNEGIRAINHAQRGIDSATDVLSFPTIAYPAGKTAGRVQKRVRREWDADIGASVLGDIVLSMERAGEQALAFGHSVTREVCYLAVHGLLHLMGYDHMTGEDKKTMREKEDNAMNAAGLPRVSDAELRALARKAMERAYVPYSHFRVGACLLCADGTVYTGCNIENASYGLCNCAERTAVFKAVSEGARDFTAIAIAGDNAAPWPCGACRQVLNEFAPGIRVLITWNGGDDEAPLSKLLPYGFGPESLLGEDKNA